MIDILTGFSMGSADAIDSRIVLTSTEMKSVDDTVMPDVYFAVNSSDGLLYVYKKGNPINKDTGKFRVVSKNDFNDSYKTKLDSLENYNDTEIRTLISTEITNRKNEDATLLAAINTKVDKEDGKGLSTNDFTNEYKSKLDNLIGYDDSELRGLINEKADKSHTHNQYATIESVEAYVNELRQLISTLEEQINQ